MASRHVSTCSSLRAGDVPLLGKAVFEDVTELRVWKWHRPGPSTGPESNDRHPDKRRPEERTDTREPGGRGRSAEAASRARGSHQERREAGRASRGLRRRPNARTADPCPPEQMLNFCGHLRPAPGSAGTFRLSVRVLCAPGDNWRVHTHHFTGPVPSGPRWIRQWDGGGGTVKWGAFWAAPHGVARGGQAPPSLGSLGSAPSLGPGGEKCTPRPAPHPPWGAAPRPPRKESLHHPPVKPPPQPRALPCQSLARVTGTAFPVLCSDV